MSLEDFVGNAGGMAIDGQYLRRLEHRAAELEVEVKRLREKNASLELEHDNYIKKERDQLIHKQDTLQADITFLREVIRRLI